MGGVANLSKIETELFHMSNYFPEDTDETITFVAGGTANIFGAWAEIVDNNAVTFSSKLAACEGHVSAILVEDADTTDKRYLFEISYGASNVVVCRGRVISGTTLKDTLQQGRRRSLNIPAGKTVYYRMKCETLSAELGVALRYHCH
jgi:hypothetical protein